MRILFLTSSEADYLADSLLLGLRQIFGANIVDYPRCDALYRNCPAAIQSQIRGHGFTLYTGLLDDVPVDRYGIGAKLMRGVYDLIIISDIWRQFGFFTQWRPYLHPGNTLIVDGADTPQVYPHAGHWWRRPYFWGLPRASDGFLYFKRERGPESRFDLWHKLLPDFCLKKLPNYRGLRRISFGFPSDKIVVRDPIKTKDFPRHIVDEEVASRVSGSGTGYGFTSEAEYYADLQASRFGVTTRRAGWDCLRHYEIAANGAVPCFRDLQGKPADCAPHGLVHGENCISYQDADDLFIQTARLTADDYSRLQQGALEWIRAKSTRVIAGDMIAEWRRFLASGLAARADGSRRTMGENEFDSTSV